MYVSLIPQHDFSHLSLKACKLEKWIQFNQRFTLRLDKKISAEIIQNIFVSIEGMKIAIPETCSSILWAKDSTNFMTLNMLYTKWQREIFYL